MIISFGQLLEKDMTLCQEQCQHALKKIKKMFWKSYQKSFESYFKIKLQVPPKESLR